MQSLFYFQSQLPHPEIHPLYTGTTVLYSTPAPHKTDSVNEDACAIINIKPDCCVLIVADGVGGQQAGDEASRIAIESISSSIHNAPDHTALRESILDGIEQANRRILALGKGSATTVVVAEIQQNQLRPYYVGDSIILLTGQRGKLKFQNISHSPVGYAVESGLMDEQEAIHHEERNLVSNVLGTTDMSIEIGPSLRISPRDTLVLASDSLPDNLFIEEIIDTIRKGNLQNISKQLINRVEQRMRNTAEQQPGHSDDFTFILYRPGKTNNTYTAN